MKKTEVKAIQGEEWKRRKIGIKGRKGVCTEK